ncbi:MAG: carbon-nitrogen hydrolase family protein [Kiritimatiellae bacterium]|nr:carbon-nitrogen hydrolase family protein [Kiritimatiellia bacterium]MDD5519712.1 carbon-nitrogen hydrolase family protein [Kiritimatiellia bacterium]
MKRREFVKSIGGATGLLMANRMSGTFARAAESVPEKKSGMRTVKLGIIQVTADYSWIVERCHEELYELTEACLKEGADLVVMPEAYQYIGVKKTISREERFKKYTVAHLAHCAELAKKYKAYIVPWDYEIDNAGKTYNASFVYDREGKHIGTYRKVQPTYGELADGITPGNDFPVFDCDFGKLGIIICFDNYFPESTRILGLRGAEIVLYPLYGDTLAEEWEFKLRTRACDNGIYVVPSTLSLSRGITFSGIVNPAGKVVYRSERTHTHAVIEVALGVPRMTNTSAREGCSEDIKNYLFKSRNPAAYGDIMKHAQTPMWKDVLHWKEEIKEL